MTDHVYLANMRVAQAKIHLGDVRWYVVNAANHVVKGPFEYKLRAELELQLIRHKARKEAEAEAA